MNFRIILLAAILVGCDTRLAGQDVAKRIESMMDRARHLSDIHSDGAPSFRLKATFSFVGRDLETVQGTYTEVWISNKQWYRETVAGASRRVEVGGPTRLWRVDTGDSMPEEATRLPRVLKAVPTLPGNLDFEAISTNTFQHREVECALTKPDVQQLKHAFCFDKGSGLMVEDIHPELRPRNAVGYSCMYGEFLKFSEHRFPREMICFEDKHRNLEVKVVDISPELTPDPALFVPPQDALELGNCNGATVQPRSESTVVPRMPLGTTDQHISVRLSLVIDTKGKPQSVKAIRSARNFGRAAIDAVRDWRFRPATCDGEPMPFQLYIEVNFAGYR
jgi:TonB family protein